jgi:predicted Zn-dependent protease
MAAKKPVKTTTRGIAMNLHPLQTLATPARHAAFALVLFAGLSPFTAQAQDAAKALGGLFQQLVRPAQPAQPAPQPNSPSGLAGALLGASLAPAGAQQAAQGGDLFKLLSQSLDQIDEPREIQIGQQLAAVLLGSKPLYPDMTMQRYINQLGRWISLQSSRPDLPWTFAILDDPGFNAFATPGGYVFVTKGLMDRVADEGELAGILAHEITHVTAKHHLIAMNKAARAGLLTQVISSQLKTDLGGMVSSQLLALGRNMYTKGLDQQDEFDADRTGVALATRAGFDPYGLVAVLQQLRTAAPDDALFALSLSTHPPAQTRLNQLEQAMGTRLDAYAGQPAVTVAQRMSTANRRPTAQAPARPPAKKAN